MIAAPNDAVSFYRGRRAARARYRTACVPAAGAALPIQITGHRRTGYAVVKVSRPARAARYYRVTLKRWRALRWRLNNWAGLHGNSRIDLCWTEHQVRRVYG